MTTQTKCILVLALNALFLTGCVMTPSALPNGSPLIYQQPVSRVKERGTHVDFTVNAVGLGSPLYQWCRNGSDIAGATNETYYIEGVQVTNVATYVCKVTGTNGVTVTSDPAHLTVFYIYNTNSVAGTLVAPIGSFSGSDTCCGKTFNRYNSSYFNFYGPGVGAASQTGNFQNTTARPTLRVDTIHADNGTIDTGIRIKKNWLPYTEVACNDDAAGAAPLSQTATYTLFSTGKYRVTVFYIHDAANPPPNSTITFNWLYE